VRRRQFIIAVGATATLAVAGHAQQPKRMRRVGVLFQFPENDPLAQAMARAFALGLARRGWVEGKNLTLDYRYAANDPALVDADAAELVALAPDVILAAGARRATNALLVERRSRSRLMSIRPSCRNFRRYASTAQHRCTGPS